MTNKKILIIRNAYFHDFGGGERFPVELASELTKHGFTPIVVSRSPKLLEFASSRGVTHKKGWWWSHQDFSGKNTLLFPVYLAWQALLFAWYVSLIIRLRPEVVHPQSRDDFIAATFAGKLFGKRVIWTDHADLKYIWQNHRIWYKNPVGKLVYRASKLADSVTLVSNSEKQLIEDQLGQSLSDEFQVIHNGVNERAVAPVKRSTSDKDAIIFSATSRLVTAKGIGELIAAFDDLSKTRDVRLWLIGEGPEAEAFKQRASTNKHIHFMGYPENALSFVAASDVFVHPSYHEGFSISLVEAAMLAKPIIACEVGGNTEIIREGYNGLLVPARDSKSIEKAMLLLYTDAALRKKLGNNSRKEFEKNYRFEKIVEERFVPLYEK